MLDVTHIFERELVLYQTMVYTLFRERGFSDEKISEYVNLARERSAELIRQKLGAGHRDLVEKLPRIVELLASSQDELLELLKKWKPQGPVN